MRSVDDMVWPMSTCDRNRLFLWPIQYSLWPISSFAELYT